MTISSPPPAGPRQPGGDARPRRRSRAGRWIPLGVAAYALLEIWLLILVAGAAGGLTVLLLLVVGFVGGALAVRHAGRSAWRALNETMRSGGPERDGEKRDESGAANGGGGGAAPIMFGGLLLMVPGLISDVAGLFFLFPPTRSLLTRAGARVLDRRAAAARERDPGSGSLGDLFAQARAAEEQMRIHRPDGKVIQGEVVDRGPEQNDEDPGPRH
ncbi:FxsA family protein [Actinacidiphila glaucinigra]|uniref:FxsA family membrane protein n=1 Tax=Actinacidiphila glaucinigra TaxID=235986 RepID=UPI002DD8B1F2|nr:FxsA family membrane protein [Actinacidiphila glaucinigra]WSD58675.1 FxsA family protein [Actinacidiphila glaucinigra]